MPSVTVTSDYSIVPTDSIIFVDSTSNTVNVTLPNTMVDGLRFHIKDKYGTTGVYPIAVVASPNLIDGQLSFTLTVDKQSVVAHCDGSAWFII